MKKTRRRLPADVCVGAVAAMSAIVHGEGQPEDRYMRPITREMMAMGGQMRKDWKRYLKHLRRKAMRGDSAGRWLFSYMRYVKQTVMAQDVQMDGPGCPSAEEFTSMLALIIIRTGEENGYHELLSKSWSEHGAPALEKVMEQHPELDEHEAERLLFTDPGFTDMLRPVVQARMVEAMTWTGVDLRHHP